MKKYILMFAILMMSVVAFAQDKKTCPKQKQECKKECCQKAADGCKKACDKKLSLIHISEPTRPY